MAVRNCCKNGLHKFSTETTMHGFQELYHAKSFFWKIIWLVALMGAVGVSVYQVYQMARDAIQQPTTTVIQPLSSKMQYPPMMFCYIHWMYWVDWNRTVELGFDKPSVLYGLGFLSAVISEFDFNIPEAAQRFRASMKENKMERLIEFYDAIAFPNPPGINFLNVSWGRWTKKVDDMQQLCYLAAGEMISNVLFQTNSNSIQFSYDGNYYNSNSTFVSQVEASEHLKENLKKFLDPSSKQSTNITVDIFSAPPMMNFDGVRQKRIAPAPSNLQTQISVTGELYHWINTSSHKCYSYKQLTDRFETCKQYCSYSALHKNEPNICLDIAGAVLLDIDNVETVCMNEIRFLQSQHITPGSYQGNRFKNRYMQSDTYIQCADLFCTSPCDVWKYDSYVTSILIPSQFVQYDLMHMFIVLYQRDAIFEVQQIESQTWSTIVGNIGGIVGLWLGASVLSILQMIYLFCAGTCEKVNRTMERTNQLKHQMAVERDGSARVGGKVEPWLLYSAYHWRLPPPGRYMV